MANFTTVADLADDALFMSGEPTGANQSNWYGRDVDLLNAVQTALISGGSFADRTLAAIDWWWARKSRRGNIIITNGINTNFVETAVIAQGNPAISLSTGLITADPLNHMLLVTGKRDQIPKITARTLGPPVTDFDIEQAWKPASITTKDWIAVLLDYALPTDFARFMGPVTHGRHPYEVEITDANTLEERFPLGNISGGTPWLAALVDDSTLRFSHYITDGPLVVEFEYVMLPAVLTRGGSDSVIPHQHRRILSLGAAYIMMWEKRDSSRGEVYAAFAAAWEAMETEHYKQTQGPNFGQFVARPGQTTAARGPLRTESGIIIG